MEGEERQQQEGEEGQEYQTCFLNPDPDWSYYESPPSKRAKDKAGRRKVSNP